MSLKALQDDLATLGEPKPRTFKDWLRTAGADEIELVMSYIHSNVSADHLAEKLRKNGVPCSRETIQKMRDEPRG